MAAGIGYGNLNLYIFYTFNARPLFQDTTIYTRLYESRRLGLLWEVPGWQQHAQAHRFQIWVETIGGRVLLHARFRVRSGREQPGGRGRRSCTGTESKGDPRTGFN